MAAKQIGTVNGLVNSTGWFCGKAFNFDGTTKGLTKSAVAAGATVGCLIQANFGGRSEKGASAYKLVAAPHDDRANGYWSERA